MQTLLNRDELDRLTQSPVQFNRLVYENEDSCVLEVAVTQDTAGVADQRIVPRWGHHLPGETVISLTGQAACILLRRCGVIEEGWRGHGVRIRDARGTPPCATAWGKCPHPAAFSDVEAGQRWVGSRNVPE